MNHFLIINVLILLYLTHYFVLRFIYINLIREPRLLISNEFQSIMENKTVNANDNRKASLPSNQENEKGLLFLAGWIGVIIATPFFLWVPLGFTGLVPSMIDVFGVVGLRIPAAVTIAGLLLAAVGFHRV